MKEPQATAPHQDNESVRRLIRVRLVLPSIAALGLLGGCSGGGVTQHSLDDPQPDGHRALQPLASAADLPDGGDARDPRLANGVHLSGTLSGFWGPCEEITCANTLVLQNNGGDDLTLTGNGVFTFATALLPSQSYGVTVLAQPPTKGPNGGQTCVVTAGAGIAGSQGVSDVVVQCTTNAYTIGGTVSGLLAGRGGLLLSSFAFSTIPKGGTRSTIQQALNVTDEGPFTFQTPVLASSTYSVAIDRAPLGQKCAFAGVPTESTIGGNDIAANITNLEVLCTTLP